MLDSALFTQSAPFNEVARVVRAVMRTTGACAGYVGLRSGDGDALELVAAPGLPAGFRREFGVVGGSTALVAALARVGDVHAAVPLLIDGGVVGTLALSFPSSRRLAEEDLALLDVLADYCAHALDRARLLHQLEQLAGDARRPLRVGDLEIDPASRQVTVDGSAIVLTPSEMRLLLVLARNPGKVVSRRQLVEQLWDSEHIGNGRACDGHVVNLRRKIERDPARPQRVITARGLGYKLAAA